MHPGRACRFFPVGSRLPLVALLVACLLAPACLAAQQAALPSGPTPPPPPPAVFQTPIPAAQLAFLSSYAGRTTKELWKDKQFRHLLKLVIPRSGYHYGRDMALSDAVEMVLDGSKLPVELRDGRYLVVEGRQGPYLGGRGFLWFDLQSGIALGSFFFRPTNGEPTPTLTVFSQQLHEEDLYNSQLPPAFVQDLTQWSMNNGVPVIAARYLIPENGKKYVLLHDERFCDPASGGPAPTTTVCEQLNAQAADVDMNAAYFMHETHNEANATAWMLEPMQIAWMGLRERQCGMGLPCRITMTRMRTQTFLTRPMPRQGPVRSRR